MSLAELLRNHATADPRPTPTMSFELFPPRRPELAERARESMNLIAEAGADFFSVTYGTSGSTPQASRDVVRNVLADTNVPVVAHLTCVGSTRSTLLETIAGLINDGVTDFLALRGDPPKGQLRWDPPRDGIATSADLVEFIKATIDLAGKGSDYSVSVAAHPSHWFHGRGDDLAAMTAKQDAGADYAITQVLYNAEEYATFIDAARDRGISLPVLPGIIPLTDLRRLGRLEQLTGVPVPAELRAHLDIDDDAERFRRGIEATAQLATDLINAGAPGLHVYTFNQHQPSLALLEELRRPGGVLHRAPSAHLSRRNS